MSPQRRRPLKKQSAASHSGTVWRWIGLSLLLLIVAALIWWLGTTYLSLRHHIQPLPASLSRAFIAVKTDNPTLLVIQRTSTSGPISSMAVARLDQAHQKLSVLLLPTALSDGQTDVSQYLQSGYDKQAQQTIEQAIAVPLTGYLIETPSTKGAPTWTDLLQRKSDANWWSTTIGLPWWLSSQPTLYTNLSIWQVLQTLWFTRDLSDSQIAHAIIPDQAQQLSSNQKLILEPTATDQVVAPLFTNSDIKSAATSIVIQNGTNTVGLANLVSRFVSNMGGEVVAAEGADMPQSQSTLTAAASSTLTENLTSFLGVPLTATHPTGRERADVTLILGDDVVSRIGNINTSGDAN